MAGWADAARVPGLDKKTVHVGQVQVWIRSFSERKFFDQLCLHGVCVSDLDHGRFQYGTVVCMSNCRSVSI